MILVFIKQYLPKPVKSLILNLLASSRMATLRLFSRTRFSASLYYCFFSRQFAREHQSVLKGRLNYLSAKGMQGNSNTLLRRNIHRIEKGLIMRPQRPIFALDYIQETLDALAAASSNVNHDQQELKWARDVLNCYFSSVDMDLLQPQIKQLFAAISEQYGDCEQTTLSVPYTFSTRKQSQVTAEQLLALCVQRRSVRWFDDKSVPRSLLEQAVEIASLAPSACNRQPYQFMIADDKVLSQKLIDIPLGTKGFAHNVPCTLVVTADLGNYSSERDRHLIYIDSALASMQLMLALETLGLSSCPINWPDIEPREKAMASLLGLADTIRPVMLIAVGYGKAEGSIPFSHKKSAKQLISYVEQ